MKIYSHCQIHNTLTSIQSTQSALKAMTTPFVRALNTQTCWHIELKELKRIPDEFMWKFEHLTCCDAHFSSAQELMAHLDSVHFSAPVQWCAAQSQYYRSPTCSFCSTCMRADNIEMNRHIDYCERQRRNTICCVVGTRIRIAKTILHAQACDPALPKLDQYLICKIAHY